MGYPQQVLIGDFLQLGEEYRRAYYNLPQTRPPSWPKYFLFCHSIELILKAYLAAAAGLTSDELKDKFGHNLKLLLDVATEKHLPLSSTAKANLEHLTDAHTKYWPRYPMERAHPVPVINHVQFEPEATELFVAVHKALHPNVTYLPYCP
jgi:hypothetical protein